MTAANERMYASCTRFFAELQALGVTEAVISPGSRSTPLALAAKACGLALTVHLDERVAGFHALGQARGSGRPSVLVCTSGTAGANYLPAVVEANHSGVPMIVCTADRPPELRSWGAGQTIDQVGLYGTNVRWFHEVPVAGEIAATHMRSVALRAVATAVDERGPIHLNWPFREPLGPTGAIPVPTATLSAYEMHRRRGPSPVVADLAATHERGLIVVGPADLEPQTADEIADFGVRNGWPIIADAASGLRSGRHPDAPVVTTAEFLLASHSFVEQLPPCEVIVHVGLAPTSKAYRLWVEAHPPQHLVLIDPGTDWPDPTNSVTNVVAGPLAGVFRSGSRDAREPSTWTDTWVDADELAAGAVTASQGHAGAGELDVVAALCGSLANADAASLVVSNSMPIRDVDAVLRPRQGAVRVVANRGANGIDGVVATACGLAQATDTSTTALVGDVAAVHDLGGMAAAARLGVENLTIVVIDNNAGGIFSFLPVAGAIDADAFDELFSTPHGTDLVAVAQALGMPALAIADVGELLDALASDEPGPRVIVARTTAAGTVDQLDAMRRAVDAALSR